MQKTATKNSNSTRINNFFKTVQKSPIPANLARQLPSYFAQKSPKSETNIKTFRTLQIPMLRMPNGYRCKDLTFQICAMQKTVTKNSDPTRINGFPKKGQKLLIPANLARLIPSMPSRLLYGLYFLYRFPFKSLLENWLIFEIFGMVPPQLFCEKWPFSRRQEKALFLVELVLFFYGFLHSTNVGSLSFPSIASRLFYAMYFLQFFFFKVFFKIG